MWTKHLAIPTIKASDIIRQAENQDCLLECLGKWDDPFRGYNHLPFALFFRLAKSYEKNESDGWFYMRVWFTDGRDGYLRTRDCQFNIIKDVPMKGLWPILREQYTMGKLSGDEIMMGDIRRQRPVMTFITREFHRDTTHPEKGYYEGRRDNYFTLQQDRFEEQMA